MDCPVVTSAQVLPAYSGPNVRGIVPGLLGPRRGGVQPAWFPPALQDAEQVVLLVIDGLGWEQLQARLLLAPTIANLHGGPITTVAPSTTSTALTSIVTGLTPAEHGIVGYRVDLGGDILNVLRWSTASGDARKRHVPADVQGFPPFLGREVPVISKVELEGSGFTAAHLSGARMAGWRVMSNIPVEISAQLAKGAPFVYAYYDGIDKIAHEKGFGPYYDAELRAVDRLVADVLGVLPPGAALAVTADHGQVHVGARTMPPAPAVLALTHHQSGEGRFRWLHAKPGAATDLLAAAAGAHSDTAWVVSREQVIDEGWFGPHIGGPILRRLGDVALAAHEPVSFEDPADSGPFQLLCRHGSLTSAEMLVPFIAARRD
jgi:Type I phosphodiesterase / nucleotide pyrophosphatase